MNPRCTPPAVAAAFLAALALTGCQDDGPLAAAPDGPSPAAGVRGAMCLARQPLADRAAFVDAKRGGQILRRSDDWARQLSAFERSARVRTLEPVSTRELLRHVAAQVLDWTAEEEAYWSALVARLSDALGGTNVQIPHVGILKTTGLDEFGAVYARNDAIAFPQGRIDISGDETRDFYLLAHEFFHVLSWDDAAFREAMYAALGFTRMPDKFVPPEELESRRLSNPGGHTYEDALAVQTPDGPHHVVPFVRSTASLEEVIALPTEGPPAIFGVLDIVLLPVDPATGKLLRGPGGQLVTYGFGNTDWVPQTLRNTSFIIHPEEILADNFATLMEWRASGVLPATTPSGFPINDVALLEAMEDALTAGCAV